MSFGYVYKFFNEESQIIYIGVTKNITDRIMNEHINGHGHLTEESMKKVKEIKFAEFDSHIDACIQELVLINKHNPSLNCRNKDSGKLGYKIPSKNKWLDVPIIDRHCEEDCDQFANRIASIYKRGINNVEDVAEELNTNPEIIKYYGRTGWARGKLALQGVQINRNGSLGVYEPRREERIPMAERILKKSRNKSVEYFIKELNRVGISYREFLADKECDRDLELLFTPIKTSERVVKSGDKICRNCEVVFTHKSRTKIYCEPCADIVRKEKNAARNRRYRERNKAKA